MNSPKIFLIESITSIQIYLLIVRFISSISFLTNLQKKLVLFTCSKKNYLSSLMYLMKLLVNTKFSYQYCSGHVVLKLFRVNSFALKVTR